MKSPVTSPLIAAASIAGGVVLFFFTITQTCPAIASHILGWAMSSTLAPSADADRSCNETELLPRVYDLNPKYREFVGAEKNVTGNDCERTRRLLARDGIRLRPAAAGAPGGGALAPRAQGGAMPLFGAVYPDGLYYIAVGLGSPAKTYYLDIDTGSDLSWVTCDAPCVSCSVGPHPWYSPRRARVVDCGDAMCRSAQTGSIRGCAFHDSSRQCDYDVHYGDGSFSQGVLVADTLTFLHPSRKLVSAPVYFGCAYDQEGVLKRSPSKVDGVIGLGAGAASWPSQLAAGGHVRNVLGHCIAGGGGGGGFFFLGDELVPLGMTWTPMVGEPPSAYYSVDLHKLMFGGTELPLYVTQPEVSGGGGGGDGAARSAGTIFDSGSSFTYLAASTFKLLIRTVLARLASGPLRRDTSDPILPYCWKGASKFTDVADAERYFGDIVLEFRGASIFWGTSQLRLYADNYLIVSPLGNVCLGILDSSAIRSGGSLTVIGDISLKGYLVVYDNVHKRVGWKRGNCLAKP